METKNLIKVSNEIEASEVLKTLVNNSQFLETSEIVIEDWENFTFYLKGEKFHNSITPSVMKGFIELQSAVYEAFALAKYGEANTNKLTQDERNALEFQVVVEEGSSAYDIDVNALLTNFLNMTVGKVSGTQAFIAALTLLILFFGVSAYKARLEHLQKLKEKELDNKNNQDTLQKFTDSIRYMTESNNEVIRTIYDAKNKDKSVEKIYNRSIQATDQLLKSTKEADLVQLNGVVETNGNTAQYLTRKAKSDWLPVRLDGVYRLLQVNSQKSDERKVKIRNLGDGKEIIAVIRDNSIEQKKLNMLGHAEWSFHPATLTIKALEKDGKIKDAEIINVVSVDTETVFNDTNDSET